jgi:hexosaminidase
MKIACTISLLLLTCSVRSQDLPITPYPEKVVMGTGSFTISPKTALVLPNGSIAWRQAVGPLTDKLKLVAGFGLPLASAAPASNGILLKISDAMPAGGAYHLNVSSGRITIEAKDPMGAFYAIQTLLQMMPAAIEGDKPMKGVEWKVPAVDISDAPGLPYRGLMIDVSRHFLPVSFLEKMVDLMAMQKMNNLHLHLTDDQGWRLEVKKYPLLTQIGAVRNGTLIGKDARNGSDNTPHRGYYTQEEMRGLVAYAAKRFVHIIPEIELPGHSTAAIAAYPALSCFPNEASAVNPETMAIKTNAALKKPGTKIVQETWGVFNDVLCPTDFTFQFMEDVLDEVMSVFPSKYIHIGGDECPKDYWKRSPFCQQLIREKGLKDEHGLQSYFIQRIEKHINGRGRSIIGWDEILEGGLAPNATVMSWRGISGGIESAKQGHDVIMSPVDHCYLNLYQSDDPTDSIAWGGMLPLKKVYAFEPIPAELSVDEKKFIKGVQANLWTEYISSTSLAEYQLFPRLAAIAELGWTKNKTGFDHFVKRMVPYLERLRYRKVNYSKHLYDIQVNGQFDAPSKRMKVSVSGVPQGQELFYSVNGSPKSPYQAPFFVNGPGEVVATAEADGQVIDRGRSVFHISKATGKSISLLHSPSAPYHRGGVHAWANGVLGSDARYTDGQWLGWNGSDFNGLLDFGDIVRVGTVDMRFFHNPGSWVYLPSVVTISVSDDGVAFRELTRQDVVARSGVGAQTTKLTFPAQKFRYMRIIASNHGTITAGNPGAGSPAWLFVDEVVVE